jgi:Holliday junction DNA helicase RuvA
MIYRVSGLVEEVLPGYIIISTAGISLQIEASRTTIADVSPCLGTQEVASLFTHLHVREDLLQLFGFSTLAEKKLFLSLNGVNGIGPKQAIKILSGIRPEDFYTVLEQEDLSRLEAIPGLGKKTAQKILLALAGSLQLEQSGKSKSENLLFQNETAPVGQALIEMGYDRKQIHDLLPEIGSSVANQLFPGQKLSQIIQSSSANRDRFEAELLRRAIIALS